MSESLRSALVHSTGLSCDMEVVNSKRVQLPNKHNLGGFLAILHR